MALHIARLLGAAALAVTEVYNKVRKVVRNMYDVSLRVI